MTDANIWGGGNISEYLLTERIVELSEADEWGKAVLEWELDHIYFIDGDDAETCLCTHYPINEVCVIRNKKNGLSTHVGNCCVKKFMDSESDLVFQALKRVIADNTKSFNVAAIEYVFRRRIITAWDYKFYSDILRKRLLSPKQEKQKLRINKVILSKLRKKIALDDAEEKFKSLSAESGLFNF